MSSLDLPTVGIAGTGVYIPPSVVTGQEIAARTGLPEFVVLDKMGICEIHVAGPEDTVTAMASKAAQRALDMAGLSALEIDTLRFLGITHMKRSFYEEILAAVGLTPEQSVYLDHFGHIQSVDQVLALELGLEQGKISPGDLIVLAGAGTGYTWSATAIRWG